jgi:hypothetical protein
MPRSPKSGEQLVQIAPMLVVASMAITVCGMFGMQEATRSPGRMPRARNWVARTRTPLASSGQDKPVSGVVSDWWYSTSCPGCSWPSTCWA